MTKVNALHKKWMKKKEYRKAYQELAPEFAVARAEIKARATQASNQKPRHLRKIGEESQLCN